MATNPINEPRPLLYKLPSEDSTDFVEHYLGELRLKHQDNFSLVVIISLTCDLCLLSWTDVTKRNLLFITVRLKGLSFSNEETNGPDKS